MRFYRLPITALTDKDAVKVDKDFQFIEDVLNGRVDDTNLADKAVKTTKLDDVSVSTAKLANDSVTRDKLAAGASPVSGQYTGDGNANREINLGFQPTKVLVIRGDQGYTFESIRVVLTTVNWWRDPNGALASGNADWQGISTNGFRAGTAANGGLSNALNQTYTYVAWK